MALFKIFKGNNKASLDNKEKVDGYAYYNTDNGLFYIDAYYKPTSEQNDDPNIVVDEDSPNNGLLLDRRPLNAHSAFYDEKGNSLSSYIKTIQIEENLNPQRLTLTKGDSSSTYLNIPTGVKGDTESSYRTGQVNITKANIGLGNVTNDAQIPKSIGTTKGDIIYWTADSTPARLAIGTEGYFLKATTDGPAYSALPTASDNIAGITTVGASGGAAAYEHTHDLSIATDNGANSFALAANTKYKLTAGGSTYIFTTPPDSNDTKQNIVLNTETKAYITGVTTTPTSTTAAMTGIADTDVYLTTTAGQMNAKSYQVDERAVMQYDRVLQAIEFAFI